MELDKEMLSALVDTYAAPGGVRLDAEISLLTLNSTELRVLAALLIDDADLLDATGATD